MRKTLTELRAIAAALGYSIVEAAEAGDSYYLVRRIDTESCVIARVQVEVPNRTAYTLRELSSALGLAIEKFAAALASDVRRHYRNVSALQFDRRMTNVIDAVSRGGRRSGAASRRTALDLAHELHELAMDLCRRPPRGPRI